MSSKDKLITALVEGGWQVSTRDAGSETRYLSQEAGYELTQQERHDRGIRWNYGDWVQVVPAVQVRGSGKMFRAATMSLEATWIEATFYADNGAFVRDSGEFWPAGRDIERCGVQRLIELASLYDQAHQEELHRMRHLDLHAELLESFEQSLEAVSRAESSVREGTEAIAAQLGVAPAALEAALASSAMGDLSKALQSLEEARLVAAETEERLQKVTEALNS